MSAAPVRTPRRRSPPEAGPAPARPPLRPVPDGPVRADPPRRRAAPARPTPKPRPGGPATTPLGIRLILLPVRLLLVPVRLTVALLARLTGGRPWLVLILALGCGVIALHAATLQTNQTIEARGQQINALERSTATLRNDVAELGAPDRVSTFGREAGMVMPDPEGIGYLDARNVDPRRASGMIAAPSPTWKPAPNVSEQNGDLTETGEGMVAADGAVAGTSATPDGTSEDPATGSAADPTTAAPTTEASDPAAVTRAPDPATTGAASTPQTTTSGAASATPPAATPSASTPQTTAPTDTTAPTAGGGTPPPGG